MQVTSIDVGYNNLAILVALLETENKQLYIRDVDYTDTIDLPKFNCYRPACRLHHDRSHADYMRHVFEDKWSFDLSETILVEQQPPTGFTVIQELIRDNYRDKFQLSSPAHVQAKMQMSQLYPPDADEKTRYELRKHFVTEWSRPFLLKYGIDLRCWDRCHDIADAFLQLCVWIDDHNLKVTGKSTILEWTP
jgi:hypothetical protein